MRIERDFKEFIGSLNSNSARYLIIKKQDLADIEKLTKA